MTLLAAYGRPGKALRGPAWVVFLMGLASCTGLRHSTVEHPMYTGFELKWTERPGFDASGARREVEDLVKPSANNTVLWMRPTVAIHNGVKEPTKQKGVRHWLKYKIGSQPVYLDELPLEDINGAIVNRLNNRGHFSARSSFEVERKGRTASVVFTVSPGPAHVITSLRMGDATAGGVDSVMALLLPECPLHVGEPYDLARLTTERGRIADRLRDQGWYRLRADDMVWAADTAQGGHRVALHLRLKPATSNIKRSVHQIASVTLHGDQDEVLPPKDTAMVDSIRYVNYLDSYRPVTLLDGLYIRPGERYSLQRTTATQRYLGSYGVFRNVLISYTEDSVLQDKLHASVTLLPQKRFSLFSEMNMVSKSNNFSGPGVRMGFTDRNLFKGAERLSIDLHGRFETQIAGEGKGTNAYEVGTKAELSFPRMLLLPQPKGVQFSTPFTNISIGFGFFRRINLYGMRSATAGLGYAWRKDRRVWHDLQLLDVSYNNLFYTSDDFDLFLQDNPTIQRSFEDQFIIGFGYTYTRSTRRRDSQRSWFVYSLGADESGNLLNAIMQGLRGARPDEGYDLFGERYSQYVRLRPELRWYQAVGSGGNQVAARLLGHAGISFGNTEVMPYVKQFFAGGTNSLRGFRARSVGPGSYVSEQADNLLVDQVGDIRMELNAEFRFGISGFVKGAWFVDAGNVWLLNEDPSRPGGDLQWDRFLSEVAINSGFGVRFDPGVIVIRLDLATPLRRPDLPAGDRWVFDDLYMQWNRNFILNIAIGYPF